MVAAMPSPCVRCPTDGAVGPFPAITVVGHDPCCADCLEQAKAEQAAAHRVDEAVRLSEARICDGCCAAARWDARVPLRPALHRHGAWMVCDEHLAEELALAAEA